MNCGPLPLELVVVLVSAALVTGCGGASPEQQANEAYASSVCSVIGSGLTKIKSVETLPPRFAKAPIEAALSRFEAATRQFVSRIKAVPAPDTSEGRAAESKIDQSPLITGVQGDIDSAKVAESTVAAARSRTEVFNALAALPDPRTLRPTAQSLLRFLQSGGGSLASAFKTEPSCKKLG